MRFLAHTHRSNRSLLFISFLLLASLKKARMHALTSVGKRAMSASETDLYTFHMCVSTLTSSAAVSLSLEFEQ